MGEATNVNMVGSFQGGPQGFPLLTSIPFPPLECGLGLGLASDE